MFDVEKEELEATPDWQKANWEQITAEHAENGLGVSSERIYRKIHGKHHERTAIASLRYAMLAIGLTAVGWLVRSIPWLAITLGIIALVFGLISAYGAGKCSEL